MAYSLFAFKGEKVNVVGYQSGKLVVSGKNMEDFVRDILEPEITGEALLGYEEVHNLNGSRSTQVPTKVGKAIFWSLGHRLCRGGW